MTEGLLQEIPLDGMIQMIRLAGGTGELSLTPLFPARQAQSPMPVGHIFFREGYLHAAFLADRMGETVMKNLFLWEAGFFTWKPCDAQDIPPANVMMDTMMVILSGFEHHKAWTQVREVIPTLRLILQPRASSPPILPPAAHTPEAQLLALCDGQTQLMEICTRLGGGRIGCRFAAKNLVVQGLLAVKPPSMGEKLARTIAVTAHPFLGVAGEIFCDEALRRVEIAPESLAQNQKLKINQVAQVVSELERDVALVLGPQRAHELADRLSAALGVATYQTDAGGIHHV